MIDPTLILQMSMIDPTLILLFWIVGLYKISV